MSNETIIVSRLSELIANEMQGEESSPAGKAHVAMAYQPKVDLASGALCGYESLLRWSDGNRIVSPEVVIRASEYAGSMVSDGLLHMIIRRVIKDIKALPESDRVPVAINLGPGHVNAGTGFFIRREAEIARIDNKLIDIEITEHIPLGDVEDFGRRLRDMRPFIGNVFIDDFGVGYSTLSALQSLRVDGVKLDKVFMSNAASEVGLSFICGIVDLCHTLGVSVVVEGVETGRDHSFAVCCGAEVAQGYGYGRPVTGKFNAPVIPQEGRDVDIEGRSIERSAFFSLQTNNGGVYSPLLQL